MGPDFHLETPEQRIIGGPIEFGGWYTPPCDSEARLRLYVNGVAIAAVSHGLYRPDVALAFPDRHNASHTGFIGELVLPDNLTGTTIEVELYDDSSSPPRRLMREEFQALAQAPTPARQRCFDLLAILRCPACSGALARKEVSLECSCGRSFPLVGGVPGFHQISGITRYRLLEQNVTHEYGVGARRILDSIGPSGLILDFGAGNTPPDMLRENIVYLEVQQYRNTDVVCTTPRLPFADGTFDAVISQAVFEHLEDPHAAARELHRVLKPGGKVYVDTAFMQPLHGDPCHYFNMTRQGLRKVMSCFSEVTTGVAGYQYPSWGLRMQIEHILSHLKDAEWHGRLESVLKLLYSEGAALDEALGQKGREILAAGVFFEGTK